MKKAIGIDIGGTGIKGALVNLKKGSLVGERVRIDTPPLAKPAEVIEQVAGIISELGNSKDYPVGICFPAIVKDGYTLSAANIDDSWIGLNAKSAFQDRLNQEVTVLNDADAAGIAEMKYGAGVSKKGLVLMATLGTGIGTALFLNGKLIPNTELGHLEIDGVDYETRASFSAKERENLDFKTWAKRLEKYFNQLNRLLSLDLIIVGGGVSKQHEEFLPLIEIPVQIVPAQSRNNAGIIGAAYLASKANRD